MRKPACCDNKQEIYSKGVWSQQEDQKLIDYIRTHGEGCWRSLPQAAGLLRCGKSCRLRWINYLRPDLKRGNFGEDEVDLIIKLHALLGNRWSLIAGRLPGRTDNEVKNCWNSHLRKKLINRGIDPKNHRVNHRIVKQNNVASAGSNDTSKIGESHDQDYLVPKYRVCGHDHVAQATSSNLGDDHDAHKLVPDLNLDLTLTLTTSSIDQGHQD